MVQPGGWTAFDRKEQDTWATSCSLVPRLVQMTLNGIKCSGVWIDDDLTWKRPVRKNCFCGHAKLRRLWDVLPPVAKKCIYMLQCYITWCCRSIFCQIQFLVFLVLHLYVMQDWLPCRSAVQADGNFLQKIRIIEFKCDSLCSIPYLTWTET